MSWAVETAPRAAVLCVCVCAHKIMEHTLFVSENGILLTIKYPAVPECEKKMARAKNPHGNRMKGV